MHLLLTRSSLTQPIEFKVQDLITDLEDKKKKCAHCETVFVKFNKYNIKRHYKTHHNVSFLPSNRPQYKKSKKRNVDNGLFHTKEELLECIVNIASKYNVPLRFWNDKNVRRLIRVHVVRYGITINSSKVRKGILQKAEEVKAFVARKLAKRMFALK